MQVQILKLATYCSPHLIVLVSCTSLLIVLLAEDELKMLR